MSHFLIPLVVVVLGLMAGVLSLLVPGCGVGVHGLGNFGLGAGLGYLNYTFDNFC